MTRLDGKGLVARRRAGRWTSTSPRSRARSTSRAGRGRGRGPGGGLRRPCAGALRAHISRQRLDPRAAWRRSAGWRAVRGTGGHRGGPSSPVAAFGVTAFLLALRVRRRRAAASTRDLLLRRARAVPHGEVHVARRAADCARILFDLFALLPGARLALARRRRAPRVAAGLPVLGQREIAGRRVSVVAGAAPVARSAPGSCVRGCTSPPARCAALSADELAAVVAHESHHAARRDPLRILIARAIGDAYSLRALAAASRHWPSWRRTPPPCAAAGRRRWRRRCSRSTATGGIAPERVDRLAGPARATRCRARSWPSPGW